MTSAAVRRTLAGVIMMTSFDLIRKAIRYEPVPRPPVAVLDGYNWFLKRNGMTEQDLYAMTADDAAAFILKQYSLMGSDLTYVGPLASGAIRETLFALTGHMPPLSEPADADGLSAETLFRQASGHPLCQRLAGLLHAMNEQLAGSKPILAFAAGPLTSAAGLMGMEGLMTYLTEDPEGMERVLDLCTELTIISLRFQLENGATGISIADPVSAVNLISEEFFSRFSLPRIRRIAGEFRAMDIPIMLHICGSSAPRIAPLVGSGINIYSMDAVELSYAMEQAGKDFAIFGNLNTVSVMLTMSPDELYAKARELCQTAPAGFILAPGCDLPPDTPEENLQAMVRAARSFRKPKISLNPDQEIVTAIKEGLKQKGGYCPCRLARTEENKCMCKEFRDQIADPEYEGFCHCMLYYKSYEEE